MFQCSNIHVLGITAILISLAASASGQPMVGSSQQIRAALATFPRVVLHTKILIGAKNYTRLPHESDEIKEGAAALEKAIAGEAEPFRAKVEPLLQKTEGYSQDVAEAAKAHDDAELARTHAALASSVEVLLAAFPAAVQPPPPQPPKN